ncbi:MAG: rhodanese-like domain-containing protein [Thioalkalispiraceae bacterium]|jgi:rhodanese-related sulfurtransferase
MYFNINEIEAAELADWVTEGENQFEIIDVREINEINAGTIPDAVAMPLATVPLRLSELDKNTPLVFVCRSGARSAQACAFLQQQGFDNVHNLRGGMFAWASAGQPIGLPKAG